MCHSCTCIVVLITFWQANSLSQQLHSQELVQGFDQETAAVVMARLASLKMETEVPCSILLLLTTCGLT